MTAHIKTGTYTGDGAAQNIELGFIPDYVRIINETDGDAGWEWFNGFGDGDAFQGTNHASAQWSLIGSNGVDTYAGSSGTASKGITIGTSLSESGKTFRYLALGNN